MLIPSVVTTRTSFCLCVKARLIFGTSQMTARFVDSRSTAVMSRFLNFIGTSKLRTHQRNFSLSCTKLFTVIALENFAVFSIKNFKTSSSPLNSASSSSSFLSSSSSCSMSALLGTSFFIILMSNSSSTSIFTFFKSKSSSESSSSASSCSSTSSGSS